MRTSSNMLLSISSTGVCFTALLHHTSRNSYSQAVPKISDPQNPLAKFLYSCLSYRLGVALFSELLAWNKESW